MLAAVLQDELVRLRRQQREQQEWEQVQEQRQLDAARETQADEDVDELELFLSMKVGGLCALCFLFYRL